MTNVDFLLDTILQHTLDSHPKMRSKVDLNNLFDKHKINKKGKLLTNNNNNYLYLTHKQFNKG